MQRRFSLHNKYRLTAGLLADSRGSILDFGSRDRRLARELVKDDWKYSSADRGGDHDYDLDLEQPIAPIADRAFDAVVALDVLEHVERCHAATRELFRIARRDVILALPNMASYQHRLNFALRGKLKTDKYDLRAVPSLDRHRWLTSAPDILAFFSSFDSHDGFELREVVYEAEGGRVSRVLCAAAASALPWFRSPFTSRIIAHFRRAP